MEVIYFLIIFLLLIGIVESIVQTGQLLTNFTSEVELFGFVDGDCLPDVSEVQQIVYEVVGGVKTAPDRFPYMVALQIAHPTDPQNKLFHWCGGTLIAPDLILTAAHCVYASSTDFRNDSDTQNQGFIKENQLFATLNPYCRHMVGSERLRVTEYYTHEKFNGYAVDGYDIAVLKVEEPFEYSGPYADYEGSARIDLPDQLLFTAVGWGAVNRTDKRLNNFMDWVLPMQMGFLSYYDLNECQQTLEDQYINKPVIPDVMVCLRGEGIDTCWGDSGGPVMLADDQYGLGPNGDPSRDIQVAITSWGPDVNCGGFQGLPGVYISVKNFVQWINNVVDFFQGFDQERKFTQAINSGEPNEQFFESAPIEDTESPTQIQNSGTELPPQNLQIESATIQSIEPSPENIEISPNQNIESPPKIEDSSPVQKTESVPIQISENSTNLNLNVQNVQNVPNQENVETAVIENGATSSDKKNTVQSPNAVITQILYFDSPSETTPKISPKENSEVIESAEIQFESTQNQNNNNNNTNNQINNLNGQNNQSTEDDLLNLLAADYDYDYYDEGEQENEKNNTIQENQQKQLQFESAAIDSLYQFEPQDELQQFKFKSDDSNLNFLEFEPEIEIEDISENQNQLELLLLTEDYSNDELVTRENDLKIAQNVQNVSELQNVENVSEPQIDTLASQVVVKKKDSQQIQSENGENLKKEEVDKPNPTILFCLMDENGLTGDGQLIQKIYVSESGGCCIACLKNQQCNAYAHCTQRRGCPTKNGQIMFYMQCNLSYNSFHQQMKRSPELGFMQSSIISGIIPGRIPT